MDRFVKGMWGYPTQLMIYVPGRPKRKPNKSLQLSPKAPIGAANVVAIAVSAGLMRRRN